MDGIIPSANRREIAAEQAILHYYQFDGVRMLEFEMVKKAKNSLRAGNSGILGPRGGSNNDG
jgi:hypothetical protein